MNSERMTEVECELRAVRSAVVPEPAAAEFVLPWYGGRSLANVPSTVAALLGAGPVGTLPPLDDIYWRGRFGKVEHIILVLLDALGYTQLRELVAAEPDGVFGRLAERGEMLPMTSVCPSTTATALVTLSTGVPPALHGMVGYELWLREFGVLTEMLGLKPVYSSGKTQLTDWGFRPEDFVATPAFGLELEAYGIRTSAHIAEQFATSALTRICYRGYRRVIGHQGLDSLWRNLSTDLASARGERSFHYVYWGGIDKAIHLHGAETGEWRQAFAEVACSLGNWLSGQPAHALPNTLLVVCADHGFVSTPEDAAYGVEGSELEQLLLVPHSGEARFAYLHTMEGTSETIRVQIQEALGPDYVLIESQRALSAGLLGPGPIGKETPVRLGHYVAIARGPHYIDRLGRAAWMRGRHGGLAPEEMLVPWLAVRTDDLT